MFYEFTSIKMCISQMSILKKMMEDWRWFRQILASEKVIKKIKNSVLYSQNTFTNTHFVLFYLLLHHLLYLIYKDNVAKLRYHLSLSVLEVDEFLLI